jgi:hypothetical protein
MGASGSRRLMADVRLIDALPDFGARAGKVVQAETASGARTAAPTAPARPEVDVAEIVRAEVARAEAALSARMNTEFDAVMQAEAERHAAELEALATRYGAEAGNTIAARIGDMEGRVRDHVTAALVRLVGTILSEDLQKRSVDSLARSIRAAVADQEAVRIGVRGPQSLFLALSTALGARAGSLDYTESDGFDLTVTIDGNLFETRISEWSAALSEVVA